MARSNKSPSRSSQEREMERALSSKDDDVYEEIATYLEQYRNKPDIDMNTELKRIGKAHNKTPEDIFPMFLKWLLRYPLRSRDLHFRTLGHSNVTPQQYLDGLTARFRKFGNDVIPAVSQNSALCCKIVEKVVVELLETKVLETREDTKNMVKLLNDKLKLNFSSVVDKIYPQGPGQEGEFEERKNVPKTCSSPEGRTYRINSVDNTTTEFTTITSGHRSSCSLEGIGIITREPSMCSARSRSSSGRSLNQETSESSGDIAYFNVVSHGNQVGLEEEGFHNPQSSTLIMTRVKQEQEKKKD